MTQSPYPGWAWDAPSGQWVPDPGPVHPPPGGQPPHWPGGQPPHWPSGQPPQQYGPPVPTGPAGPTFGQHVKRAFDWNVSEIAVSPKERQQLEAAGVAEPRMQALLAWRRSTLLIAIPILLLSVILAVVDAASAEDLSYQGVPIERTALGNLQLWLPSLSLALVPLGAWLAISKWTELRRTSRSLIRLWILSITIPLLTALLPIDTLFDFDLLRANVAQQDARQIILGGRVTQALSYALALLPVIITIPAGVLRGAGRMRFLFPGAPLPAWFLVSVAPFYSIFLIVMFILIDQIVGNFLLVVGVGLMAFGPWLFILRRKVYARPMSIAEARVELPKAGKLGGILALIAFGLIVIFMLSGKVEGADVLGSDDDVATGAATFTYLDAGRTAIELFGRNLATTVVFAMVLLTMLFAEWRTMQQLRPDVRAEYDQEMQALSRYVATDAVTR